MKGIIIAAGMGNRLGYLTQVEPKTLLKVGDTTLLENIIAKLRAANISDIAVVVGYQAQHILNKISDVKFFANDNFKANNILHSLMYAKSFMDDDVVISYSDIWLDQTPVSQIAAHPSECVVSVDSDWEDIYIGRTDHPVTEAENVIYDEQFKALKLGKFIKSQLTDFAGAKCGEFIGLSKITKEFCKDFIATFDDCNQQLMPTSPFQNSKTWHNAYLTDFFNELIARQFPVSCSIHQKGWREIDTQQDYQRLCEQVTEQTSYAF
jgi:choline kinase